jgi:Tfp pilus assembly protein PilF
VHLAALLRLLLATSIAASVGCASLPNRMGNNADQAAGNKFNSTLSLARLSERHGQTENARQVYEAIVRSDPANTEANHRLAVIAARERKFAIADEHFQKALAADPVNPELLTDFGYFHYLQNRYPEAEELLRRSLELAPDSPATRTNLGLVVGEQGRLDEAFQEFLRSGDEAQAHANMGYLFAAMGDLDRAENEYHMALALNGSLRPAGEALAQIGERRRALRPRSRSRAAHIAAVGQPQTPGAQPPDPLFASVTERPLPREELAPWRSGSAPFAPPNEPIHLANHVAPAAAPEQSPQTPTWPTTQDQGVQQASFTAPDGGHAPRGFPTSQSPWSRPTWTAPLASPGQAP